MTITSPIMERGEKKNKCLLFTWFPLLFPRLGVRVQEKINAFADKVMCEEHPTRPTTTHLNLQSHKDNDSATCPIFVLLSGGHACPASHSAASGRVKTRPPLQALLSDTPLITNVGQKYHQLINHLPYRAEHLTPSSHLILYFSSLPVKAGLTRGFYSLY